MNATKGLLLVLVASAMVAGQAGAGAQARGQGGQRGAPGADEIIRRIDQRMAMVKERAAQRANGGQGGGGQGMGQHKGRRGNGGGMGGPGGGRRGMGGRGGRGGRGGGHGKGFARIEQRLASSNMSEADKARVRARIEAAKAEMQALRGQHEGRRGGRRQQK